MNVNWDNLNRYEQFGTGDKIKFGKYRGEVIGEVAKWDSEYILYLYDQKLIKPNSGLLKLIHDAKEMKRRSQNESNEDWNAIFDESY